MERGVDITAAIIRKHATAIREADTAKEAIRILIGFCEYYRKNYHARRTRLKYTPRKYAAYQKKWWDAHKDEYNEKRNAKNRLKAEEEWNNGLRTRKPRHL